MHVNIYNKQRRLAVDVSRLEEITGNLSAALFEELKLRPPKWLKRSDLRSFAERGEITLMLVSNPKIRKLNQEFRGKDSATDVLSFPLVVSESGEVLLFPGDETIELGELVISLEKAEEQAQEYGHSFEREFAFLFVHGVLHVLGFDHITKAQEQEMFSRQTKILVEAGFPR
jgi:probable rRNA maturation factor